MNRSDNLPGWLKSRTGIWILGITLSASAGRIMAQETEASFTPDTLTLEDVTISVLPFMESREEASGGYHFLKISSLSGPPPIEPAEVYNLVPGILMVSGSINTNRLIIRGVGSRTPYSTNRIRAYLDEIPLTSGDGISTLEDLDLLGIGSIEVLKGPSSALYGSGLGGVVRLSSLYPEQKGFSASLKAEYSSFQTGRTGAVFGYKQGLWAVSAGAVRSRSEGYRENSQYDRMNLFLNARRFGGQNTFTATLSYVDLEAGIPSSLNETDFTHEPWRAAANWLAVEGFERYRKLHAGMELESRFGKNLTNHLVLFSSLSDPFESRPFNILDDRSLSTGVREYLQVQKGSARIRTGVELFSEWYEWQIYETIQGDQGAMESDQQERRQYLNLFLAGQWRPGNRLIFDGGMNMNVLSYNLNTVFRSDSLDNSGQYRYEPVVSPRAGFSFQTFPGHYLYASAGHGFSAPSLEETLLPEGAVNTELKPESGWNLEAGNRGSLQGGKLRYDLTLYVIYLNNLLVTERITEDIFTGANAGKTRNTGIEAWMQYYLFPDSLKRRFNAVLTVAYALSDNRFTHFIDDGTDRSGNRLPGIPVQTLSARISLKMGSGNLGIHYRFTGRQWMDDGNEQVYGSFHLLSLQAGCILPLKRLPFGLELNGGITNLLDAQYASMILVNAPSFGGNPPRSYYPGLPRHYRIGMTILFGKPNP